MTYYGRLNNNMVNLNLCPLPPRRARLPTDIPHALRNLCDPNRVAQLLKIYKESIKYDTYQLPRLYQHFITLPNPRGVTFAPPPLISTFLFQFKWAQSSN
jgi:hypothetical protein